MARSVPRDQLSPDELEYVRARDRERIKRDRQRRFALTAANGGIAPAPAQHGKPSTVSNWGCECIPCTTAYAAYHLHYSRTHPRKK